MSEPDTDIETIATLGGYESADAVITEVQEESPALQGGDESDNRLHKPPTIARPDIPTDT